MRIARVTLATAEPDAIHVFYGECLGLPRIGAGTFAVGNTRLELSEASPGSKPAYHVALGVPSNLFAEAKAWVSARTDLLRDQGDDELFFEAWNAHACYFADPAGNVLELIAHHEDPIERPAPFSPDKLVGVAEIGLPVPDVEGAVGELRERFGLEIWDGRGMRPNGITPLGGRHGGFIVVAAGRPWFPIGIPSAPFPLEVLLEAPRPGLWRPDDLPYVLRA